MNAPGLAGLGLRSPAWTALVSIFMADLVTLRQAGACAAVALFPFPAGSFLGVFQDHSGFQQLGANLVRAREIPRLLGLRALGDEGFHLGVRNSGLRPRC